MKTLRLSNLVSPLLFLNEKHCKMSNQKQTSRQSLQVTYEEPGLFDLASRAMT